ncbi:DHS-like NAD/FAD-binding domain-containing protein [Emericellopsis atlantica]|uniref:protein acetyllysine N-acetyltransferase n=1 Tax=Emericellopsis atlantica TaxID=2614577 RepID=A0A9P8CRK7_9HYPO|nr:DHS-like NAD/FAD-binding domain-containing protein [Emericellopsis atlantica]KAG9254836.1 DHS-like NAD/FAD-binding domain-containing protein [Emericellopsis atlantica]
MADSAPPVAAKERREPAATVAKKAALVAKLIQTSKHLIAFTGAGVSTSAGIPDFRGPDGNWTLRAQGKPRTKAADTLKAIPTASHMALVELQNHGFLKYLISQNCDGLHRRSGILPERISELHGNSNRETCKGCGKEYLRDFRAVASYKHSDHDHRTGRKCALCNGDLHDSIINFGEDLPEPALSLAKEHAREADLCLVIGSSLTVTPANEIPEMVGGRRSGKLVICNLQQTPIDSLCEVRVFSEGDMFMQSVMEQLGLTIPGFILRRHLSVKVERQEEERYRVTVGGIDTDGTPMSFLQSVRLEGSRRVARSEPFMLLWRDPLRDGDVLQLELEFMGHYNEPKLRVDHEHGDEDETIYVLEFDPLTGVWAANKEI